ncbi:hypothetical protein RND71_008492 [Anisodus tanguticus]|uniref:Protein TIFY n=1 Tax=Anisodus tanguticus TaxID=243964 RepID=A0AAE1SKX1_9SOLA|nr:hypothetical protein RND71_008492 [Anisodus tanguticus]
MISSSEIENSGKKKSHFSQTCTLLSQYLKENNKTFSTDLSRCLGPPATMNLFPMIEKSRESVSGNLHKPMNLFPQAVISGKEKGVEMTDSCSVAKLEKAQMTIFYAGRVIVFNEFLADKVKEIMLLAGKKTDSNNISCAVFPPKPNQSASQCFKNTLIQESSQSQVPSQPIISDLPIARKASLTRFLGKRKDRLTASEPYPIRSHYNQEAPYNLEESNTWLGLGPLKSDN